jgi:CheY-like chemotaxis protein
MGTVSQPIAWDTRLPIGPVMVVDDEVLVRVDLCKVLAASGLDTVQAGDGQEAVERYQAHRDTISLVILDASTPRLGGVEAAQIIRNLNPSAKVILTHRDQEPVGPGQADAVLAKPLTLGVFCDALQKVLKVERRRDPSRLPPAVGHA